MIWVWPVELNPNAIAYPPVPKSTPITAEYFFSPSIVGVRASEFYPLTNPQQICYEFHFRSWVGLGPKLFTAAELKVIQLFSSEIAKKPRSLSKTPINNCFEMV